MKQKIQNKKGVSSITYILLATFIFQTFLSPSLFAVTVEEQVFSKEEKDPFQKGMTPEKSVKNAPRPTPGDEMAGKTTVTTSERVPYKDPRLACLLSLILPGSGEVYLRKDVKGISFCLATTTAYLLSFYFLYQALLGANARQNYITGGLSFLAATVLHIVGMVESYNDAVQINEARYYFSE